MKPSFKQPLSSEIQKTFFFACRAEALVAFGAARGG
jgi:hypothetical protein